MIKFVVKKGPSQFFSPNFNYVKSKNVYSIYKSHYMLKKNLLFKKINLIFGDKTYIHESTNVSNNCDIIIKHLIFIYKVPCF